MSLLEAVKKKSCQSCTRAKAKCSPHEAGGDVCYRCHRMGKECFFETSARKIRPTSRSRVSNLEHRFDTLIDLLATNGGPTREPISKNTPVVQQNMSNATTTSTSTAPNPTSYFTPAQPPSAPVPGGSVTYPYRPYDPIEAGEISPESANSILNTFRSFVVTFPFVVLQEDITVENLRRQQPFLFLAIMMVTTYATPSLQRMLLQKLKTQIAYRVIENSEKSLEIIQGLLVYVAWYIFFFKHQSHQLSIMTQICVAMVQDLQLSKNGCQKTFRDSDGPREAVKARRTTPEKRAYLGTYYLAVAIAQAWRKPNTMSHTRCIVRYCQSLSKEPEYPTDTLIAPLIQLSELMMRVNDHFSYDNIEDADIKGEMLLVMAADNFHHELERIKETVPTTHSFNRALQLKFSLVDVCIHEVSLHSALWTTNTRGSVPSLPPSRLKMFQRILNAISEYLVIISATPDSHLYSYTCCDWAGWFYCNIVACRLVFLADNDRQGHTALEGVPNVMASVTPPSVESSCSTNASNTPCDGAWAPACVARETRVQEHFESFINKLSFTMPSTFALHRDTQFAADPENRDPLSIVVILQHCILKNFLKRLHGHDAGTENNNPIPGASNNPQHLSLPTDSASHNATPRHSVPPGASATELPGVAHVREPLVVATMPIGIYKSMHSIDFASIQDPMPTPGEQELYDDWIWDTMMADFTMPPI